MDRLAGAPLLTLFEGIEGIEDMSPAERVTMMADVFRERRDLEPVEVTAHLRPHRLIQQLQELTDVDAQLVDALVGEGKVIVPLLVGVLRGWAQNFLPEDDESVVENALAVLGEIGDAAAIPHLLEFIVRDQVELAGAAGW